MNQFDHQSIYELCQLSSFTVGGHYGYVQFFDSKSDVDNGDWDKPFDKIMDVGIDDKPT